MVTQVLRDGLSSHNGFVRKIARALLAVPKWNRWRGTTTAHLAERPPVLANSFPKSGTHLLVQVLEGLPGRENYGAFLGSETSSFQLRERSTENTLNFVNHFVAGEIIRGHLYFKPEYSAVLKNRHAVNYFIYRDPRDVVVSEAHYLREMNRWHRLHPYFRDATSIEDAIMLSISGFDPPVPGVFYPDIDKRFERYESWLHDPECFTLRFEDLVSERQPEIVRQIAEFYAARTAVPFDLESTVAKMQASIAPKKSHTFRSGKKAGWQKEFTLAHRERFAQVAGDLLVRLAYEPDHSWAHAALASQ